jgi:flavorubredoxin
VSGFSVQPPSRTAFRTQLDAIGIFFGTSTGNTESVADLISSEFGDDASDPIDIDAVQGKLADEFAKYDALIVGTPTWNTGMYHGVVAVATLPGLNQKLWHFHNLQRFISA